MTAGLAPAQLGMQRLVMAVTLNSDQSGSTIRGGNLEDLSWLNLCKIQAIDKNVTPFVIRFDKFDFNLRMSIKDNRPLAERMGANRR